MPISTSQQTIAWLKHFGYLNTRNPSAAEHDAAVVRMQQVYGLKQDSIAGPITRRAMGLYRCAVSDSNLAVKHIQVDEKHCRWQKPVITYCIGSKFQLANDREKSIEIIRQGFDIYEPLTGLRFIEVDDWNAADIQIGRGRGSKWDFDGPGNVLAWAYMPCATTDISLLAMFDDSEPWNLNLNGPGVVMLAVWLHELGHLLGLDHSDDPNDLMAPYYNPRIIFPQLGDKKRLAFAYGLDIPTDDTPADPVTPTPSPGLRFGAYSGEAKIVIREQGGVVVDLSNLQSR